MIFLRLKIEVLSNFCLKIYLVESFIKMFLFFEKQFGWFISGSDEDIIVRCYKFLFIVQDWNLYYCYLCKCKMEVSDDGRILFFGSLNSF